MLDEFANIGLIPNFEKLIATVRSREISACVILQAQSQLKAIYRDNSDTIVGNMDTTLFLGGKEKTTLKEMSELLGKETIDLMNTSQSFGNQQSHSQSNQRLGKDLMSMDEISVLDGSKCILQIRGVRPFLSYKYDIEKHPNYKYLSDADPKKAFDIAEFVKAYKDSRAKLLEGLNKKNTKHVVIEINEDETAADAEAVTKAPDPAPNSEPSGISDMSTPASEPTQVIEPADTQAPTEPPQNDIKTDNNEDEDFDDDSEYFDPDDTELV